MTMRALCTSKMVLMWLRLCVALLQAAAGSAGCGADFEGADAKYACAKQTTPGSSRPRGNRELQPRT